MPPLPTLPPPEVIGAGDGLAPRDVLIRWISSREYAEGNKAAGRVWTRASERSVDRAAKSAPCARLVAGLVWGTNWGMS